MKEVLRKFCLSDEKNGLLLIDMPTGTGKTHNCIEFIYENYKKINNRIIFITNLKKNLPFNKLKQLFIDDNNIEAFNNDVIFLDNNVDTLIENFPKVEKLIPDSRFSKNGTLINIKKCINIITKVRENLKTKSKKEINRIISTDSMYYIINQAKEDLTEKYEKELRILIEEQIKFDDEGHRRTKAQKIELIKNNKDYQWISILYPSVFTDEKKIIFMSIDKFLVRNSTIVEPSYNIIDNKFLLKDSLLFIDEFDASKEILLKSIIKDCLDNKVNIVELFRIIYSGLHDTSFSKLLIEESEYKKKKIKESKKTILSSQEIINEFRKRSEEIEIKYHLAQYHKLDSNEKEKANFLFQDYKFHTVLSDENYNVYLDHDKNNRVNWIKKGIKTNLEEDENLFTLLSEIKSYITFFQNGIKFIAENYIFLKKERNQETNNFSFEASVRTVLSEFGIEGKYANYLTAQIINARKSRSNKLVDLKTDLDNSVYEKGFRFYNFIDNDSFDTQSKIDLLSFSLTPEKILIYLCLNSKVIGISASGTLETVTGNYDLDYIKKKIGKSYYQIEQADAERIDLNITQNIGIYDKININIEKCIITHLNYNEMLQKNFDVDNYNQIISEIKTYTSDDFVIARYCKLAFSMNNFFLHNIKSFLFLTNVSMKNSLEFNYTLIQNIFKILTPKNTTGTFCYSLDGAVERFDSLKESIKEKLKNGNSVFVVSTYQTLGAGQNLQYEYDPSYEDLLQSINDNTYNKKEKDFEAIFLDKPTNLFVNMNSNATQEQLLKFIYQIKCLEEVGDFDVDSATKEIKKAIKILYHNSSQKIQTPRSKHIYMHTTKIILQAIGRICRTSNKDKNIYIWFDCQMENDLSYCKNYLKEKKLNIEFKSLLEKCENIKEIDDENIYNINNSKIEKSIDAINRLKEFKSTSDIEKWEELREIVLKYPCDNCNIHNEYDIYCQLPEPLNHYYYNKDKFGKFNITYQKSNDYCINEDVANLKTLLAIPGILDLFREKGYATTFNKSNYILLPNVFGTIYLGALGEVIGEYIINHYLSLYNLQLQRISILERYEKFDFVFDDDKYVDFKHWSGVSDKDREKEVKRILNKLDKVNGKHGFIINILKPQNYNPRDYESPDSRLTIIPYLWDPESKQFNQINLIKLIQKI